MKLALVGVWLLLWVASLALPVAIMDPLENNAIPGWVILFIGWMGPLVGQFGWIANLAFPGILALTLVRPVPVAFSFLLIAAQASLLINAIFWRKIYDDTGASPIVSFGLGYYIWFCAMIGSAIVLLTLSLLQLKAGKGWTMTEPPHL